MKNTYKNRLRRRGLNRRALLFAVCVAMIVAVLLTQCDMPARAEDRPPTEEWYIIYPSAEPRQAAYAHYPVPLDEELQRYISEVCRDHHVDPAIVLAVIEDESHFDTGATGDEDTAQGASYGLMQISLYWHRTRMDKLGVTDLYDPRQNILVGVDFLAELIDQGHGIRGALSYYNSGSYTDALAYADRILARAEEYAESVMVMSYVPEEAQSTE